MQKQKGFTLIELMTTLGVATILLSIAVPGIQQFKMNARQTNSINDFVSVMRLARNTAITNNMRVTVCATSDGSACASVSWNSGLIAFVDRDADRVRDVNEPVIRSVAAMDNIDITSAEFANYFVFRPNGRVMSSTVNQNSGQFTVCDERGSTHSKAIMIELSGRPKTVGGHSDGGPTYSCP